jgi:pimeloyl-ACP methyl ester carboxylesterase
MKSTSNRDTAGIKRTRMIFKACNQPLRWSAVCLRSLLLLVSGCITLSGAAESEVIRDNTFRQGFILWEPKPGKHIKYGEIHGAQTNGAPVWGLSQWSSRLPIQPVVQSAADGSLVFNNAAKSITLQSPGADLTLAANSAFEYGPGSRKAGEPRVHLLVEQEFENPPFLHKLAAAKFHLEARLLKATDLHRGDYDPGVHAAQFQVFFTVQNRNRQSAGHGDLLWFGIPIYDNRHRHPPELKSKDFGGTEKFIFTPAATNFTPASAHDREWVVIDRDLLPLMREALEMAWAKGFLSGSTNFADYAIGGMNMGWELPGMFDVALETRKLSLIAAEAEAKSTKVLPRPGEIFLVQDRPAFLIASTNLGEGKPWVWYAPTLPPYPGQEERWMFERFTAAGISIAGIDVGESYGSPAGRRFFTALYDEMVKRGFSSKPVLLGRSRGGLMTLAWAAENPDKVGGFAGIYPVCNIASYPGIEKAAPAFGLTAKELESELSKHNPIDRLAPLAQARIPMFAIHGDMDAVVPVEQNSGLLHERYIALGAEMQLIVPPGQGHTMWTGYFQCPELVEFVEKHAR